MVLLSWVYCTDGLHPNLQESHGKAEMGPPTESESGSRGWNLGNEISGMDFI